MSYTSVVGHKFDEFRRRAQPQPRWRLASVTISRKATLVGARPVRLKDSARVLYFDCVLNAILKNDEVVGVEPLARDVTEEREKERRFTELFETLQEGVYSVRPKENCWMPIPPWSMLGYRKGRIAGARPQRLNFEPGHGPVLGRSADDQGRRPYARDSIAAKGWHGRPYFSIHRVQSGTTRKDHPLPGDTGRHH